MIVAHVNRIGTAVPDHDVHQTFIGYVHRIASRIDGDYELVAGALSSDPALAQESGRSLGLAEDRIYTSFAEMAVQEAARTDGIQAVSIVTPNHLHFAPAKAFLEAGIHVICDKPLTSTLDEARALAKIKPTNGAKFLLTHNYTGGARRPGQDSGGSS